MEERQKNGLEEALETGASAAHLARGAVKAGKAVSGAAKGAAVGGPYGAAAGALWEGRKFVGKVLAAAAVLLLLPVLFVLMLPGLIFDGFSSAFSPADTENPISTSWMNAMRGSPTAPTISAVTAAGLLPWQWWCPPWPARPLTRNGWHSGLMKTATGAKEAAPTMR